VVPNAAIAATRIAKVWRRNVIGISESYLGELFFPIGISRD
jgi:hypothetical protein